MQTEIFYQTATEGNLPSNSPASYTTQRKICTENM